MSRSTLAVLIGLIFAVLPASAMAATAELTSPTTGDCLYGTNWPVKGSATGGSGLHWEFILKRTDTEGVLAQATGSNAFTNATIATFDTTQPPVGVPLRAELQVSDAVDVDYTQRVFTPIYDRQAPQRPDVDSVLAVSATQVWAQWLNAYDLGCKGGPAGYVVEAINGDGSVQAGSGHIDLENVANGMKHEGISQPWLIAGTNYRVQVRATDGVNVSAPGKPRTFTTTADYQTVLAGQVKPGPLSGIEVSRTPGSADGGSSITDTNGWYRLKLDPNVATTYAVTYRPCTFLPPPYCATGWVADTDQVTVATGYMGGRIMPRHKTLVSP